MGRWYGRRKARVASSTIRDARQAQSPYWLEALEHRLLLSTSLGYTLVDLGTLGGSTSVATDINNAGEIVGSSTPANSTAVHAFRVDTNGTMHDLGTLGGRNSEARRIGEYGRVVGWSDSQESQQRPFATNAAGAMTRLPDLGGSGGVAEAINAAGHIAGWSWLSGNLQNFAYRIDPSGALTNLGSLGGTASGYVSAAYRINDSSQVAGYSWISGNVATHAFRTNASGAMEDLGSLGGNDSRAFNINNSGQTVGYSNTAGNGPQHAFLFTTGTGMSDLGVLAGGSSSVARDVNDAGSVVGSSQGTTSQRAFLWTDAVDWTGDPGEMMDLNTLLPTGAGWHLESANAINNSGQIVGTGIHGGQRRAFLLNPAQPQSFFDDFNRPDLDTVGNGWREIAGNQTNPLIRGNELTIREVTGRAGIYRPWTFERPVTVSATLKEKSGYNALPRQYGHSLLSRHNGTLGGGYGIFFGRSDINYDNSGVTLVDTNPSTV